MKTFLKRTVTFCALILVLALCADRTGNAFAAAGGNQKIKLRAENETATENIAAEEAVPEAEEKETEEENTENTAENTEENTAAPEEEETVPAEPCLIRTEKTMYVGRTYTLVLNNAENGMIKWKSSKPEVASVNEEGVVTSLSAGETTITAKYRDEKYTCAVTVKNTVQNLTYKRLRYGTTFDLKIKGADIVSYTTSMPKVATVDENGTVTGNRKGSAVISALDSNGTVYECNVDVYLNVLDIADPKFSDLAPTTKMSFEELVGNNGNYDFPVGYPASDTYRVTVDLYHKVVMVFTKDDNGEYKRPVRYMICSVGADATKTPTGKFRMQAYRVRNSIFNNTTSYAQYWSEIAGKIYFHTILYTSLDAHDYTTSSWNALGSAVSHGCVRLTVPDARWIWYNIAPGTIIEIRRGSSSDKETALIRSKLLAGLPKAPSSRPALRSGEVPYTDNWEIADIPNEVPFVQSCQQSSGDPVK